MASSLPFKPNSQRSLNLLQFSTSPQSLPFIRSRMSESTLYERIGGESAIASLIADFYDRVLGDPELEPFFHGVAMDRLRHMQREFFSAALDGPVSLSDVDIAYAHHGRGITAGHFNRFVQHLLTVLESRGVDKSDRMEVIRRISTYVDDVTGDLGAAGD